jgi:hypothetical protein
VAREGDKWGGTANIGGRQSGRQVVEKWRSGAVKGSKVKVSSESLF